MATQQQKKVIICIPWCHIPVIYQLKTVISCSLWYWKYHWYNKKKPFTGPYTSYVFVYCTYTKISKIWSDMFSHHHFFGHFSILSIYQIKILKNHILTHMPNKILKHRNFEAHLLYFIIHSSNIKSTNLRNYSIQFWIPSKLIVFSVEANWVRAMDIVVLKTK